MKIKLFILVLVLQLFSSCLASSWPDKYDYQIYKAAKQHLPGVDWRLYKAQLIQESALKPLAVSKAGAKGLAQFMPGTWSDISRELGYSGSPFDPHLAIPGGAFYMSKLRRGWSWNRPEDDKHNLALASYNAGFGNLLKAQKRCSNAILYAQIISCLSDVTGHHSNETIGYVLSIRKYHKILKE